MKVVEMYLNKHREDFETVVKEREAFLLNIDLRYVLELSHKVPDGDASICLYASIFAVLPSFS